MAQAQVMRKGRGFVLISEGFMFHRNQTRPYTVYWRCSTPGCPSRLRTNVFNEENNNVIIQNVPLPHNHIPEDQRIERQVVVNEMVTAIQQNPTLLPRRVFDNTVNDENNILRDNVPSFNNVRSILQRARADVIPGIPPLPEHVIIDGEWANTWRGERLLLENDQQRGILFFATDTDLRLLMRCQTIFADGTFKSSPVPYTQFFTVHGEI